MAGYGGDSVAEHCLERPKGRDLFKCGRVTLDPRYRVGFIGGERFEARGWLDAAARGVGKGFFLDSRGGGGNRLWKESLEDWSVRFFFNQRFFFFFWWTVWKIGRKKRGRIEIEKRRKLSEMERRIFLNIIRQTWLYWHIYEERLTFVFFFYLFFYIVLKIN